MEQDLMSFLNKIGVWNQVKQKFVEYLRNIDEKGSDFINSSLVLPLQYDYSMFSDDFHSLGQFLIINPLYYEHVLRNVILTAVNTELDILSRPFRIQFEQIHFVNRFAKLPLMDKYKFYPKISMSLSNFTCIVAGRGEVEKYTRQTVWQCNKKCTLSNVVANAAPICELCFKTMVECVPLRDMSEHVNLIAYPLEMVQTPKRMGTMYQKFDVILRDDLVEFDVVYGNAYIITGNYDAFKRTFYAWNIVELVDD